MTAMTQEYAVKEQGKFEENYWKICFFKKKKKIFPLCLLQESYNPTCFVSDFGENGLKSLLFLSPLSSDEGKT